jgi:pantoate--beta-alanine ligase
MLAQDLFAKGERDSGIIRREMTGFIRQEPLADIDYISIADAGTLKEIHHIKTVVLVSMAVRFGKTRLIDNLLLG